MKGFVNEFKTFILRGNVVDLAVGIIIGSAFTSIVNSLVNDVIMPLISVLTGGISFEAWNIVIGTGEDAPVVALGTFVAAILNFVIVALVIFLIVKAINEARKISEKKKEEEAPSTKDCPFCFSTIPIKATKCSCCTADIPADSCK